MFVVYRAAGANQIEQVDKDRWHEIAQMVDKDIICVTEIEDVARRAKGIKPKDLGNGIRLSGRIKPDSPAGPEHDRYEYLIDYRLPNAPKATTLHVWAQGPDDFSRNVRLAIMSLGHHPTEATLTILEPGAQAELRRSAQTEVCPGKPVRYVLIDEHNTVVDIVDTIAEVGAFVVAKVNAGVDFDVQNTDHRCGECGEETVLNAPHAPQCPINAED